MYTPSHEQKEGVLWPQGQLSDPILGITFSWENVALGLLLANAPRGDSVPSVCPLKLIGLKLELLVYYDLILGPDQTVGREGHFGSQELVDQSGWPLPNLQLSPYPIVGGIRGRRSLQQHLNNFSGGILGRPTSSAQFPGLQA